MRSNLSDRVRERMSDLPIRGIRNLDIKRSDMPLLIALDVLLEERNVTRAARRLNLSQPALSGQLARLRELFDDPLLVPSENGRGMVPTQRAIDLHPRLVEALSQLHDAVRTTTSFDPTTSKRTFIVAANDSVFTIVGLPVMAALLAIGNPALKLAVVPIGDPTLVERMARSEVDLFLGDVSKVPDTLKSRTLLVDRFQMAQRKDHPRGTSPASLDEYCALPHVIVSQHGHFHSPIDQTLAQLSRTRNVVAAVPSYNQVALVLANTECVSTLPGRLLSHYRAFVDVLDLPFEVPAFNVAMAWHPRAQNDEGQAWLRKRFIEAAASG